MTETDLGSGDYTGLQIKSCKDNGNDIENVKPEEAEFWGVYALSETQDPVTHLHDLPSKDEALKYAKNLKTKYPSLSGPIYVNGVEFKKVKKNLTKLPGVYSLCEAVADLAFMAGDEGWYRGDSREDTEYIINKAKEFEAKFQEKLVEDPDYSESYMEQIMKFFDENFKAEDFKKLAKYRLPQQEARSA